MSARGLGLLLSVVAALAVAFGAQAAGTLDGAEQRALGARFAERGTQRPDDLVVVAIDDASFNALERQWPFPRAWHARVVRRLHQAGARRIVYDVQFTERTTDAQDFALYDAVAAARGVLLATTQSNDDGSSNVLGGDRNLRLAHARAAAANFADGPDGLLSRVPYATARMVSLAVAAAEMDGRAVPAPSSPETAR